MQQKLKEFFLGKTLKDSDLSSEKFNVLWGLPIYSSDAISSVAYAGEEILLVLVPVIGMASYGRFMYCIAAIILLLAVLIFSYRQTIDTYPQGGGAYIVARENIGETAGLVAGSSLTIGYILTVAVSACAGAAAIVSAFPVLLAWKAWIAFVIVCLLTWGNLRGMRDSAKLFGVPTYLFIIIMLGMILSGLFKIYVLGYSPDTTAAEALEVTGEVTIFLMLRAFAAGCTALTGVEAVSNGVPSFRDPSNVSAKRVLMCMAAIVICMFGGVSWLTRLYYIVPDSDVTSVAQLAAAIFGSSSIFFYLVQIATVVILSLAANTAFAGLPVLLALMAKDGYMPRRYNQRGARLNYSNGIFLLFLTASALIFLFGGETHLLLALYATGVFVSFTLSQVGMFLLWCRKREGNWRYKALVNGIGGTVTAVTCIIIAASKFTQGAWMVLVCTPLLVVLMRVIRRHYDRVAKELSVEGELTTYLSQENQLAKVIVPLQSINRSFFAALNYARSLQCPELEVYHVASEEEDVEALRSRFAQLGLPAKLVIERTPYRNSNEVLIRHIDQERQRIEGEKLLTVVMPQFVIAKHRYELLHNHTSRQLMDILEKKRRVSVISIPFILDDLPEGGE